MTPTKWTLSLITCALLAGCEIQRPNPPPLCDPDGVHSTRVIYPHGCREEEK